VTDINKTILKSLPSRDLFDVGWEPEYYGAIHNIAQQLNQKYIRPYAPKTWLHGWQYMRPLKYINQVIGWGDQDDIHFVHTEEQKKFCKKFRYKFIEAVGAPFIYVKKSPNKKFSNSLLAMLPHGLEQAELPPSCLEYLDIILAFKKNFETVCVCVHPHDAENQKVINKLLEYKLPYVIGAQANDKNSLVRMRCIFDAFDYMTTNTLGSHIPYAAFCGCKISIYGKYPERSIEMFSNDPWYQDKKQQLEYDVWGLSEDFARSHYGFLFQDPHRGLDLQDWAKSELGFANKKNFRAMRRLMGWSSFFQLIDKLKKKKYAWPKNCTSP
jgi:hypothetical protein